MKRANRPATFASVLGAIALVAIGSIDDAAADVKPPTGWQSNPDFAAAMSPRTDLFGGLPATATADVYRAPIRGAVLYVTRIEAKATAEQRDAAASYEVDELRRALERAGDAAKAQSQAQRVDPATKLLEGTLAWRDDTAGLVSSRRVVIAADANRVVGMLGECVLAIDLPPDVVKACEDSLKTIVPDVPAAERVPLSIVASPTASTVSPAVTAPGATGAPTTSSGPSMGDGSKLPAIPPMQVSQPKPPERETDRRPVLLGLGLVVLAIVFYLNRSRRERFDREDARSAARDDAKAAKADKADKADDSDDDDALHAAAESTDDSKKKGDDDTTN